MHSIQIIMLRVFVVVVCLAVMATAFGVVEGFSITSNAAHVAAFKNASTTTINTRRSTPTTCRTAMSLLLRGGGGSLRGRSNDNNQEDSNDNSLFSPTATAAAAAAAFPTAFLSHPYTAKAWKLVQRYWWIMTRELRELSSIQRGILLAAIVLGWCLGRCRLTTRYTDVSNIPSSSFGPDAAWLSGTAVSVTDGDTLRFLHRPWPWSPRHIKKQRGEKASELALPIRVCTIDTPETAKFGKSGQPFGPEAKQCLSDLTLNRNIQIRLLQKDQYGRAVACVQAPTKFPFSIMPTRRKCVDEILLKQGLAEVYEGGGAVYGPLGLDRYLELQDEARTAKKGIWSQKNRESAAEYKKRTK